MKAYSWVCLALNQQKNKEGRKLVKMPLYLVAVRCNPVWCIISIILSLQYWWTTMLLNGIRDPYSPCLFHENFEAIRAGGGDRKVKTVAANAPNNGGGVHVFVGNLSGQQLP